MKSFLLQSNKMYSTNLMYSEISEKNKTITINFLNEKVYFYNSSIQDNEKSNPFDEIYPQKHFPM